MAKIYVKLAVLVLISAGYAVAASKSAPLKRPSNNIECICQDPDLGTYYVECGEGVSCKVCCGD